MKTLTVNHVSDLRTVVKENTKVHVVGNGSKTGLAISGDDVTRVKLSSLIGITEYQPEEYTITVQAGTPVKVVQDALAKNGQYLPFDPMLSQVATIGGTVASNLSGARRFRYGGVRDFILGAGVVDGQGRSFRVGGKVVKNSAGFDLTKFLVGSLGHYAIMTDVTFKVFPDVPEFTTLKLVYGSLEDVLQMVYFLNQSTFELDALDFEPQDDGWIVWMRMTGLADTLAERADRLIRVLRQKTVLADASEQRGDATVWDVFNRLAWTQGQVVVKVPIAPKQAPTLDVSLAGLVTKRWYSVGGNVLWTVTNNVDDVSKVLETHGLTGLCVLGDGSPQTIGVSIDNPLSARVKAIFDPENKLV